MIDQVPVPTEVLALGLLDRVDYGDAFEARTTSRHSPREWGDRLIGSFSPHLALFVRSVHRHVGRMHLAARDEPDRPMGWAILDETPEHLVLGVDGGIVTPRVVILPREDRVVAATVLRYESPLARPLWWVTAPIHRAVVRHLLRGAVHHAEPGATALRDRH